MKSNIWMDTLVQMRYYSDCINYIMSAGVIAVLTFFLILAVNIDDKPGVTEGLIYVGISVLIAVVSVYLFYVFLEWIARYAKRS